MLEIAYTKTAQKALIKIDAKTRGKLIAKIEMVAAEPEKVFGFVTDLVGEDGFRIRQGDYRAICLIEDDQLVLQVIKVGHRKNVYRR